MYHRDMTAQSNDGLLESGTDGFEVTLHKAPAACRAAAATCRMSPSGRIMSAMWSKPSLRTLHIYRIYARHAADALWRVT